MTDEKLNGIIKALKLCTGSETACKDCPYRASVSPSFFVRCEDTLHEASLEAIEALKAENAVLRERLSKAVELPCKVGDTVYEIIDGEIRETEVIQLKIDNMGLWITIRMGFGVSTVLFNKVARIYLTREAAEARLKELQGEEE